MAMASPAIFLSYFQIDQYLLRHCAYFSQYLDAREKDELVRRRFLHAQHRSQYIYSRLMLKTMLSDAINVKPRLLRVHTMASGQPKLFASGFGLDNVSLSISHDRDRLLVAAGCRCRIGVDIQIIHGVEWPLVMFAMGWSADVQRCLFEERSRSPGILMTLDSLSALIWAGYESWLKLSGCTATPADFAWNSINLVEKYSVIDCPIYEMRLSDECLYNEARILLMLRSNDALAVATLPS